MKAESIFNFTSVWRSRLRMHHPLLSGAELQKKTQQPKDFTSNIIELQLFSNGETVFGNLKQSSGGARDIAEQASILLKRVSARAC